MYQPGTTSNGLAPVYTYISRRMEVLDLVAVVQEEHMRLACTPFEVVHHYVKRCRELDAVAVPEVFEVFDDDDYAVGRVDDGEELGGFGRQLFFARHGAAVCEPGFRCHLDDVVLDHVKLNQSLAHLDQLAIRSLRPTFSGVSSSSTTLPLNRYLRPSEFHCAHLAKACFASFSGAVMLILSVIPKVLKQLAKVMTTEPSYFTKSVPWSKIVTSSFAGVYAITSGYVELYRLLCRQMVGSRM